MSRKSHFKPGQTVIFRELWQDKVWSLRPETLIQDKPDLMAFYLPDGTIWKRAKSQEGAPATTKDRFQLSWILEDEIWKGIDRLRLSIPSARYSVLIFWNSKDKSLRRWYINLEEPLNRTVQGFDYTDLLIDIVAVPDLTRWYWRDEDELEDAVSLGFVSPKKAATLRFEGEKVVNWLQSGNSPFNGWEDWRPNPSWQVPTLPSGWDKI